MQLLNNSWHKSLNELNCHLHPLDTFATKTRTALRKVEEQHKLDKGHNLMGGECYAGNIIVQMNKMRYKDGKGDPRGFKSFLDSEGLPRGIIPRYRGNRLHVLFHIAGVLMANYHRFAEYLSNGTTQGGLRKAIRLDFATTTAHVELQVLGLLGKILTGPWMKKFYVSAKEQIDHVEGIQVVKKVLGVLKEKKECPMELLTLTTDLFGGAVDMEKDAVLLKLREKPKDEGLFKEMMKACMEEVICVIEKQYKNYFMQDVGL